MTELREIYYCSKCGNVVEILQEGAPSLVCCGEDMKKLEAQTADMTVEKHVPVIEENGSGIKVKVGSTEHPMADDHYIKFIEVMTDSQVLRAELKPGQKPEAGFPVSKDDVTEAREFCNVHMLWKA